MGKVICDMRACAYNSNPSTSKYQHAKPHCVLTYTHVDGRGKCVNQWVKPPRPPTFKATPRIARKIPINFERVKVLRQGVDY